MEYNVTPQERAEWEYKTRVDVAKALAASEQALVPTIMVGSGNGTTNPMDYVGMDFLYRLAGKLGNSDSK